MEKLKGALRIRGTAEGTDVSNYLDLIGAATGGKPTISGGGSDGGWAARSRRNRRCQPAYASFHKRSWDNWPGYIFQTGSNGATEVMRLLNSGLVGIGLNNPQTQRQLYKNNSSTTPYLTLEQDDTGDTAIQWLLTGTRAWIAGIDNSDSDKWKLASANGAFATRTLEIDVNGNAVVQGSLIVDPQAVTGAGALTLGKTYHSLSNASGSTYAVTLAAPTSAEDGIVKAIKMIAGDGTNTVPLALTNVVGGSAATTARFDSAGETLILQAAGGKWVVIKEFGVTLT